ncbi:MAG TPA: BlaI/MecI/CopY family transcriptional regulator [Planctomycetaceae bacterium]|jgi:predicted transcriptional regulator|nr:BlaI/MecI/CopY family transcriptional regulator [Planctomycetaceae bacterium]
MPTNPLTTGELDVIRILWEHGELKPAQIQRHFPRPIKNAALRSYLSILLEKGHVTRRQVGKAYFYKAKTKRESAFFRTLKEIINSYCEGSPQSLVMALIKSERLSGEELLRLKQLAEEEESPPSRTRNPRTRKTK